MKNISTIIYQEINMQSKINFKIHNFVSKLKEEIFNYISEHEKHLDMDKLQNFLNNYQELNITEDDLKKRKRKITTVKPELRCKALKKDGSQCTRSKQSESIYCGTHLNKQPHGSIDYEEPKSEFKTIKIRKQDVSGITCYIDDENNIYNQHDIRTNNKNPEIIGKWIIDENGNYVNSD
jgi:hypothetical protein